MHREALLRNTNTQIFFNAEEQTTKDFKDPGNSPCALHLEKTSASIQAKPQNRIGGWLAGFRIIAK
ncbi:MAG: hypothetical protein EA390_10190, partial [Balneolaceae bacterium]